MGSEDWKLASGNNQVWAVATATTPSSIYSLTRSEIKEFSGHDNEAISCSTDITINTSGKLLAINCDDELIEISNHNGIKLERSFGKISPSTLKKDTWIWDTHDIIERDGKTLLDVAIVTLVQMML